MFRYFLIIGFILKATVSFSQQLLTRQQATTLAGSNRVNIDAAQLDLQRQQQLLKGSRGFDNPEIEFVIVKSV